MCCKSGKKCITGIIAKILVIIGGLNWGLVGVGMLLNSFKEWNLVKLVFSSMPIVEAIIYVLVGIAAIVMIFGCNCKKCANCCKTENLSSGQSVPESATGQM